MDGGDQELTSYGPPDQIQSASKKCTVCSLRMTFTFLNGCWGWRILHGTWKSYEFQFSVSINEASWSMATLACVRVGLWLLLCYNGRIECQLHRARKPKIFTIWLFTGNVCLTPCLEKWTDYITLELFLTLQVPWNLFTGLKRGLEDSF